MAWQGDSSASFTGASGQMAVIGELMHRKCNAAVPHIDVGMDVFAFRDDRSEVARIQVKTAPGTRYARGAGYRARFGVPMRQLRRADNPPLFYALVVRLNDGWGRFVVISRERLSELWDEGCGSPNRRSGDLELTIQYRPPAGAAESADLQARCGTFDLTNHLDDWECLPPLKPVAAIEPGPAQA